MQGKILVQPKQHAEVRPCGSHVTLDTSPATFGVSDCILSEMSGLRQPALKIAIRKWCFLNAWTESEKHHARVLPVYHWQFIITFAGESRSPKSSVL